ncbi:hypothetical protein SLS57_003863 [Botryosphaeria dothidea]
MLFLKTILTTALLSPLTLAAPLADAPDPVADALEPRNTPAPPPSAFGLVAHAPGQPFDKLRISAARGGLALGAPNRDAVCGPRSDQKRPFAAFTLRGDGEWYLWDPKTGSRRQRVWSDVSGMGQGVLQYTKDERQARGLNLDRITTSEFGFMGAGTPERPSYMTWRRKNEFIACPSGKDGKGGPWSVWLNTGVKNPGWNKNCKPFRARTVQLPRALGCKYTN